MIILLPGAIFPFNRIVAYYGNFYSKKMGVLGEYPTDTMFAKLNEEIKKWQAADSTVTCYSGTALYRRYSSGVSRERK